MRLPRLGAGQAARVVEQRVGRAQHRADDRVRRREQLVAHPARSAHHPAVVLGRDAQRRARQRLGGLQQPRQQDLAQHLPPPGRGDQQAQHAADPARQVGRVGRQQRRRRHAAYADLARQRAGVEDHPHPVGTHPARPAAGRGDRVGAAAQPPRLDDRVDPGAPRRHRAAGGEGPVGPQVDQHRRERPAEDQHGRLGAARRPALRDEVAARGVGAPRVADQAVARAPPVHQRGRAPPGRHRTGPGQG